MVWFELVGAMFSKIKTAIASAFNAACKVVAVISALSLGCGVATAQNSRLVYLPIIFHSEAQDIRTTACLQVNEHVYPKSAWWEKPISNASMAESAFKEVIAAIKRKDRAALFNLSDPVRGQDPKRFDEQATAFFQQFGTIDLVAVPRAYESDGLIVYFAELRSKGKILFAPFVFAYNADGSVKFLPYRTEQVTYFLVQDWFKAFWGPGKTEAPAYCADEVIKSATRRVSLVAKTDTSKQISHPGNLFFTGVSLDTPEELTGHAALIKLKFEELKSALPKGIDEFVRRLTPAGGTRLKNWFNSAGETERNAYKSAVTDQRAFFAIDAWPLIVLYTKSSSGAVQVMYFTANANNDLLWANSSHITVSDKVFKRGMVYNSALLAKPFSNTIIK